MIKTEINRKLKRFVFYIKYYLIDESSCFGTDN